MLFPHNPHDQVIGQSAEFLVVMARNRTCDLALQEWARSTKLSYITILLLIFDQDILSGPSKNANSKKYYHYPIG